MSDTTTIARPYAKAIFELARDASQLGKWSDVLVSITQAVLLPEAVQFITNPVTTAEDQAQLILQVVVRMKMDNDAKLVDRFVILLAENKRLLLVPAIYQEYERLRAEHEKTLTVNVRSYTPLSDLQQQRLIDKLTKRLKREVTLDVSIDESLMGGALIQAGDLVIDGSVIGKLSQLRDSLVA